MRILLMGNHNVACTVLDELKDCTEVVGVVTHPLDLEDGVKYKSLQKYAQQLGLPAIRARPTDSEFGLFIKINKADLLWVTDYRYILPKHVLDLFPQGAVNLHPSLLPKYRGRAPLNWALIHGEDRVGLTAHLIDEGVDNGDIIHQREIKVLPDDDIGVVLDRMYPIYRQVTRFVVNSFIAGKVPRTPQNHSNATTFGVRKPADGRVDWSYRAIEIHNLVRAITHPYPGAYTALNGERCTIWKSLPRLQPTGPPGRIVHVRNARSFIVACGQGSLEVIDATWGEKIPHLSPGMRFVVR